MPEISIIVPVYNVEEYLSRCIDSILNQTFTAFELILVDDGSTDNSGLICDEYKKIDSRIKVIHKENGGLSSARNSGLNIASGEYVAFVDSDDLIDRNMIELMINCANNNDADIVSCSYIEFKNEMKLFGINNNNNKYKERSFSNLEALENYLLEYNDINRKIDTVVWNKIYRKKLFKDVCFPVGKIYEDGYVTYKLLYKANKVIYLDVPLYFYFKRENSISNSMFSIKHIETYDDWREIFRFINKEVPNLSKYAAIKYIRKDMNLYNKIKSNKDTIKNYQVYQKLIKKDLKEDYKNLIKLDIGITLKGKLTLFLLNNL